MPVQSAKRPCGDYSNSYVPQVLLLMQRLHDRNAVSKVLQLA